MGNHIDVRIEWDSDLKLSKKILIKLLEYRFRTSFTVRPLPVEEKPPKSGVPEYIELQTGVIYPTWIRDFVLKINALIDWAKGVEGRSNAD